MSSDLETLCIALVALCRCGVCCAKVGIERILNKNMNITYFFMTGEFMNEILSIKTSGKRKKFLSVDLFVTF